MKRYTSTGILGNVPFRCLSAAAIFLNRIPCTGKLKSNYVDAARRSIKFLSHFRAISTLVGFLPIKNFGGNVDDFNMVKLFPIKLSSFQCVSIISTRYVRNRFNHKLLGESIKERKYFQSLWENGFEKYLRYYSYRQPQRKCVFRRIPIF